MKKLLFLILGLLFIQIAPADTVNLNWIVDGQTYAQTSCATGDDLILPTAPTKYGYTFRGWSAYTFLKYIQIGNNQWINTGVLVSSLTETPTIETTFQMVTDSDVDWFGTTGAPSGTIIADIIASNNATYIRWGTTLSTPITFSGSISMLDALHTLKLTGLNTLNIYKDDVLIGTSTTTGRVMSNAQPIMIGRGRNAAAVGLWYDFKIQNGDTVVFHGVAARRNSDGAVGMYDLVSGTFFGNAGTGTFIAGSEL